MTVAPTASPTISPTEAGSVDRGISSSAITPSPSVVNGTRSPAMTLAPSQISDGLESESNGAGRAKGGGGLELGGRVQMVSRRSGVCAVTVAVGSLLFSGVFSRG